MADFTEPTLIDGGLSVDDRGQVAFANGFDFEGVKRFYLVSNHRQGFVRAWHAHRREAKWRPHQENSLFRFPALPAECPRLRSDGCHEQKDRRRRPW